MSRYKSEQTAYNSQKKKNVPIRRLDTNTAAVTYFNADTLTEESKTHHADYIGIIFIILTISVLIGFVGSSTRTESFSTSISRS